MKLNDKQRIQAAKDIWQLMYDRGVWHAELAIDTYRREAETRLAMRNLVWYRVGGTLFLMNLGAFLAISIAGIWIEAFAWFWELAASGAGVGLVVAIMLWRKDAQDDG